MPFGGRMEADSRLFPTNPELVEVSGPIIDSYCDFLNPFTMNIVDLVSDEIVSSGFNNSVGEKLYEILPELTLVKYVCSLYTLLDRAKNYYIPEKKIILYGYNEMMFSKLYKGYNNCELFYRTGDKIFTEYIPEYRSYQDITTDGMTLAGFLCNNETCAFIT